VKANPTSTDDYTRTEAPTPTRKRMTDSTARHLEISLRHSPQSTAEEASSNSVSDAMGKAVLQASTVAATTSQIRVTRRMDVGGPLAM